MQKQQQQTESYLNEMESLVRNLKAENEKLRSENLDYRVKIAEQESQTNNSSHFFKMSDKNLKATSPALKTATTETTTKKNETDRVRFELPVRDCSADQLQSKMEDVGKMGESTIEEVSTSLASSSTSPPTNKDSSLLAQTLRVQAERDRALADLTEARQDIQVMRASVKVGVQSFPKYTL